VEHIRTSLKASVDWVQIREKDLPARDLLALAREAVSLARFVGGTARVIVNDRLDIALAAGAAGVHLGHESIPAHEAIGWSRAGNAPPDFLVGVSCHTLDEARDAEKAGASYVIFGPIFPTPSKQQFGPPQGLARLTEICSAVRIPVIAIGGINAQNGADCLRAGASGIAAIRMFQESPSTHALKIAIDRVHRHTR
jgi:thiamine-phosphate pyrophosphorylase